MRRLLALLPLLAVIGCAGCASTPQPIDDEAFASRVSAIPSYAQLSPDSTIDLARGLCTSLQAQPSEQLREDFLDYYAALAEDERGNGGDSLEFADAAIARFCPDMTLSS